MREHRNEWIYGKVDMGKDDECLFWGYGLGSGGEKAGGAGREARKSMEGGLAGLCVFLPAHPAHQKQGGKVSRSYSMSCEGFLPAPPASPPINYPHFTTYPPPSLSLFYIKTN